MATIDLRMQSRRDTAANWSSTNPTLAEGEIGYVTDGGYYKIGDGTTAWGALTTAYQQQAPISVGDFNISSTDETYDLGLLSSLDAGIQRRVSWFNGDGSNTFTFTGTSETIDGIAFGEYVGQGTGHLNLRHLGSGAFETFDVNVWDNDGGQFTGGEFEKTATGKMEQTINIASSNDGDVITFPVSYATAPIAAPSGQSGFAIIQLTSITTTGGTTYQRQPGTGNPVNSIVFTSIVNGRWTTSQPRRS